jgi:hypothetical protein
LGEIRTRGTLSRTHAFQAELVVARYRQDITISMGRRRDPPRSRVPRCRGILPSTDTTTGTTVCTRQHSVCSDRRRLLQLREHAPVSIRHPRIPRARRRYDCRPPPTYPRKDLSGFHARERTDRRHCGGRGRDGDGRIRVPMHRAHLGPRVSARTSLSRRARWMFLACRRLLDRVDERPDAPPTITLD